MSTIDILIATAIIIGLLFAVKAIIKAKKSKTCIGCSHGSCNGCCDHSSLEHKCEH